MARLSHPVSSIYRDVQLELLACGREQRAYLNVRCLPLCSPMDDGTIPVAFSWGGEELVSSQILLDGGHRILLSADMATMVIDALLGGYAVDVRIGHYAATLVPDGFAVAYAQFTET